jgi:hypothetical protein
MPSNAHAALWFAISNDYANVSQSGNDPIQPGTVAAQGFKIDFGAIGGVAPHIGLVSGPFPYGLMTFQVLKPVVFPGFVNQLSTNLTGNHQVVNNNSNIATAFYRAAPTEVVSPTGFVHVWASGCAVANFVQYTAMTFTDSTGNPVGLPNFILPAFGFGRGISQGGGNCVVPTNISTTATDISTTATDFGSVYEISQILPINPSITAAISYLQVQGENQLTFMNPSGATMQFAIRSQIVQNEVPPEDLNGDNTVLSQGFSAPTIVTLAPGEEIVIQAAPVPEPSSLFGLLAIGTLGAGSTLKRKLKPSKSTEKETTKVG